MAKPIRSTPTLNANESLKFVERMIEVEKRRATKKEQFFIDLIAAND